MENWLICGIGGVGEQVCRRVADRLGALPGRHPGSDNAHFLTIDTHRGPEEELADATGLPRVFLGATAAVLDAAYRSPERFGAEWIDRDILRRRGTLETGTHGSRMLARFLLFLPENLEAVRSRVERWTQSAPEGGTVYLVANAGGGTGSGLLLDTAYLVQQVAAQAGVRITMRAVVLVPPVAEDLASQNALATLTELHYFSDPNTRYSAAPASGTERFSTRKEPFSRIQLLVSQTSDGHGVPHKELVERAAVYLLTACEGDNGSWAAERRERELDVAREDADGNPQVFATFGTEWVEYPEERLVSAVYRNLVRRSVGGWIHGDAPVHGRDFRPNVPLSEPNVMARLLLDVPDEGALSEELLRPVTQRRPWIHTAPPHQWSVMDTELEGPLKDAIGTPPAAGGAGKGPIARRAAIQREQAVDQLRAIARGWLSQGNISLERIARTLAEGANELATVADPAGKWETSLEASRRGKRRLLDLVGSIRRDPFLLFGRRAALRKLSAEYERLARLFVFHSLQAATLPHLQELRRQTTEPVRVWATRVATAATLLSMLRDGWAREESQILEGLRAEEEAGRLALGLMRLPGQETPFVGHSGWEMPYASPEDEAGAIRDLNQGWIQRLAVADGALLALPGRSELDGGPARPREVLNGIDAGLRDELEDRLRGWLHATTFQRLAEQYRDPIELEFRLRRMVGAAADLPALEPPHARPEGFPSEYGLVFFGDMKGGEIPQPLRMVADAADRERPTRVVPSRLTHYLTAVTEHAGFSLARCPAYFQLHETVLPDRQGALPFNRRDVPWPSATLVTRGRLRDASDVLFLALAFGVLRPAADGSVPLPSSLLLVENPEARLPLPAEFDLAVRQLAGDEAALEGVSLAVDRVVQAQGVEWCSLQIERILRGDITLRAEFPGADEVAEGRRLRLTAMRALSRYEDLREEFARSGLGGDVEWLRAGEQFACPNCGFGLGTDPEKVPGACPQCREPLVPKKLHGAALADGFRRIPNPYVVGTPLETGAGVFVGREDIIRQVRDRLIRPAHRTILILIGERRSGKTSALKQLQYRLEGDLTPLFIDLQGLTATDLPGFLWWLAWRIKEGLDERGIQLTLPSYEEWSSGPPDYQFETVILPEIRRKLSGGRVLLMMDEFEVLAQRVMKGTFDSRAFDYLRHLMQHADGIEFLFSGTHILRQFAANYVTFLFNIGVFLNVDFLTPPDALRLIQEPVRAAGVTYDEDALASILELAGSHPYFTQMFGFHLVERLNRLRKRHVTREDVEQESGPVIAAASAHLDHVWGQLADPERLLISYFAEFCPRGQSCAEEALLQSAIQDDSSLRPFVFRAAVEKLEAVGLLRAGAETSEEGREVRTLRLTAEVYRQWLLATRPYRRLREEGLKWG